VIALLRLRGWKQLHRLAYVAALLVLQHMLLSPFASRTGTLLLLGAGLLLVALKLLIAVQTRRGRWRPTPET
jgi:DMSO/TMAO reductase YedYZ heme-binding membrane subunit